MKVDRRLLVAGVVVAAVAGGIWAYQRLTFDDRVASIDINFRGPGGIFATSGAILPMSDTYDVGLGYFDIALSARPDGLTAQIKSGTHDLAWQGDLVFYTLATEITVPIDGTLQEISIYDTSKPAADGATGPLWVGDLMLQSEYRASY